MGKTKFTWVLPPLHKSLHLPWKPNTSRGDLVADPKECNFIFVSDNVCVEEKVDGSMVGMALFDGHPLIRNKDHILKKGYTARTPAKKQYAPVWNWWHDHVRNFRRLEDEMETQVSVYGEWVWMQHGVRYDELPSYFVAFDLYNVKERKFYDPALKDAYLEEAGFATAPILHYGPVESYEQLEEWANGRSCFSSTEQREGIYIKVCDEEGWITHRFRMVRQGFERGKYWSKTEINKNSLI